ncbi:cytochrome c3 family protein [Phototrophicus methaneseepsis]|uniref:Cytochrome c3 family protein n=1 Tax=Phototrophicus methaneseepsis TaxID=2710758 RepID=A0A7S8EDI1_9CHLR|nr:cytochrome c3 family protein [Phototrophicus methaneseepsis]QPC84980.1 cytochrome c3 family protein [Phototrophicus methaneseepsis]
MSLIGIDGGWNLLTLRAQENTTVTPAPPTPYVSIFDLTEGPSATELAPTQPDPTGETEVSPTTAVNQPDATSAAPARIPSIFDPPSANTDQSNTGQTATEQANPAQPTRIPSIFDPPSESGSSGQPSAEPTRIQSIFDSSTGTGGSTTGGTTDPAQPTPYVSVFDMMQSSVIRFEGEERPDKEYCLSCHANPYLQLALPSGEIISVTVDEEEYAESVHGQHGTEGYRCIRCHDGMNEYPHEAVTATTARELQIEYSASCVECHTDMYDDTLDGVHFDLLANGNENAAVCADCHTGHGVQRLNDETTDEPLPESGITSVEMCTTCHADVFEHYASSVHGEALLAGNNDMPTCADCHGIHNTEGPTNDSSFRLFSPQTCAKCHSDEQLMAKYDVSTDVFDTYVSDFHGTTVMLFQKTAADQDFNAPVCVDCHGVHDISPIDAADSPVLRDNLITTCRRCHPDASSDFPAAWLGHYPPTLERTPLVALAQLFYNIFIPVVIGGLVLFVITDIYRRLSNRREEH